MAAAPLLSPAPHRRLRPTSGAEEARMVTEVTAVTDFSSTPLMSPARQRRGRSRRGAAIETVTPNDAPSLSLPQLSPAAAESVDASGEAAAAAATAEAEAEASGESPLATPASVFDRTLASVKDNKQSSCGDGYSEFPMTLILRVLFAGIAGTAAAGL